MYCFRFSALWLIQFEFIECHANTIGNISVDCRETKKTKQKFSDSFVIFQATNIVLVIACNISKCASNFLMKWCCIYPNPCTITIPLIYVTYCKKVCGFFYLRKQSKLSIFRLVIFSWFSIQFYWELCFFYLSIFVTTMELHSIWYLQIDFFGFVSRWVKCIHIEFNRFWRSTYRLFFNVLPFLSISSLPFGHFQMEFFRFDFRFQFSV